MLCGRYRWRDRMASVVLPSTAKMPTNRSRMKSGHSNISTLSLFRAVIALSNCSFGPNKLIQQKVGKEDLSGKLQIISVKMSPLAGALLMPFLQSNFTVGRETFFGPISEGLVMASVMSTERTVWSLNGDNGFTASFTFAEADIVAMDKVQYSSYTYRLRRFLFFCVDEKLIA